MLASVICFLAKNSEANAKETVRFNSRQIICLVFLLFLVYYFFHSFIVSGMPFFNFKNFHHLLLAYFITFSVHVTS